MLNKLPKITGKSKKRVGRGWGSGKGKYAGRGNKGQKSREGVKPLFEGGQAILSIRLPMLRGKGKNKPVSGKPTILNVGDLEKHTQVKNGMVIDKESLIKAGMVVESETRQGLKLLGKGKLTKKLTVKISSSKEAIEKVKAAGGEYQS